ncbi:hypothetical protein [Patiriisocius marinus]|nr:hypothetical protein [Patiriisocius marinus]
MKVTNHELKQFWNTGIHPITGFMSNPKQRFIHKEEMNDKTERKD